MYVCVQLHMRARAPVATLCPMPLLRRSTACPPGAERAHPALVLCPGDCHPLYHPLTLMHANHFLACRNWRTEFRAGSVKLTELVLALQRRGYVQAEQHLTTKGTVYWRRLDAPGCLRPVGGGASRKHTPAFLPPLQHTSQLKPASAFPQQQHVDAVPPWQQQRQEQQQHQQQALPPWPWQQQQQQQPQRPPLPQVPSQPCATSLRSSPPLPSAAVPKLPGSSAPLSLAVLPLPQLPPQQQQQQLQQQPEALPAAKRQRTDDGEGSSDGELEPGELVQEAGAALPALMAKQQQRPGAPARSQAPQAAGQRAEGATPSGQAPPAQKQPPAGSGQLRKAREHMPPGGALEALLLQLVADADRAEPGCWHTIGALGTMIGKHNRWAAALGGCAVRRTAELAAVPGAPLDRLPCLRAPPQRPFLQRRLAPPKHLPWAPTFDALHLPQWGPCTCLGQPSAARPPPQPPRTAPC